MRRIFKLSAMLLLCVFLCAGISSCTHAKEPVPLVEPTQAVTSNEPDNEPEITKTIPGKDDTKVVTLRYYTVSGDGQLERATSMVQDTTAITPELVLDFLIDSLEDESLVLKVESVTIADSVCVISFDDTIYDIASEGERIEDAVLDAIAQSILDNVPEVSSVRYLINGGKYVTDNNSFTQDSAYMDR